ncbi:MAG: IS1 family transposase [SAR324 cluster bacterium]|nr:IS1 family transposase [SAR324 cluster bacterium]
MLLSIHASKIIFIFHKKSCLPEGYKTQADRSADITPKPCAIEAIELDEQWSYVHSKANQQWLWYAWSRDKKCILYYVIGKRTDASCKKLLEGIRDCQIEDYYTDNWQSYSKCIPASKHFISKKYTQGIERNNLNFRTHLKRLHRKTICFSKDQSMHEAVIKLYINHAKAMTSKILKHDLRMKSGSYLLESQGKYFGSSLS